MSARKTIFVCDDHAIIIDGLKLLFEHHPRYQLVGFTAHGDQLLDCIDKLQPEYLLLDLNLGEWDGLTLLEELRQRNTTIKVIILTMYHTGQFLERARKLGANGFLPKSVSNDDLILALDAVSANRFYLPESIQQKIDEHATLRDQFVERMKLTRRELEIIQSIVQGLSSHEMADHFNVSAHTVETHRKNILRKLGLSNVAELVHFAHQNHLIS